MFLKLTSNFSSTRSIFKNWVAVAVVSCDWMSRLARACAPFQTRRRFEHVARAYRQCSFLLTIVVVGTFKMALETHEVVPSSDTPNCLLYFLTCQ